jgi:hypothetical protein
MARIISFITLLFITVYVVKSTAGLHYLLAALYFLLTVTPFAKGLMMARNAQLCVGCPRAPHKQVRVALTFDLLLTRDEPSLLTLVVGRPIGDRTLVGAVIVESNTRDWPVGCRLQISAPNNWTRQQIEAAVQDCNGPSGSLLQRLIKGRKKCGALK